MKVKELIAVLKNFHPDAEAVGFAEVGFVGLNHVEVKNATQFVVEGSDRKWFSPLKDGQEVVCISDRE